MFNFFEGGTKLKIPFKIRSPMQLLTALLRTTNIQVLIKNVILIQSSHEIVWPLCAAEAQLRAYKSISQGKIRVCKLLDYNSF